MPDDEQLIWVQLPADVADELTLTTSWLSSQLEHQVPLGVLRRALLFGGLAHPRRALAALVMAGTKPVDLNYQTSPAPPT